MGPKVNGGSLYGVMANLLDFDTILSEFKLQLHY